MLHVRLRIDLATLRACTGIRRPSFPAHACLYCSLSARVNTESDVPGSLLFCRTSRRLCPVLALALPCRGHTAHQSVTISHRLLCGASSSPSRPTQLWPLSFTPNVN